MVLPSKNVMAAICLLATAPLLTYADIPLVPTLCTPSNKGSCECGEDNIETYVWWIPGDYQRCIHTYNLSSTNQPRPVLVSVQAYGQGMIGGDTLTRASYYNYAAIGIGSTQSDGGGGFGLEFPNDGVVNGSNPTPCDASDSREYAYLLGLFDFIEDHNNLDAGRVFFEGFSQNSMFAAYAGVCFADRVAGLWQGGSGLAKTGYTPVVPGKQAQCTFSAFADDNNCCKTNFCEECTWWPVYPRTCEHKIVDCISTYTNDNIACGSDWYMYNAMVAEGNDARLLSFSPSSGINGGHNNPQNKYDWMVGCLGIVDSCTTDCEDRFLDCAKSGSFNECAEDMENGDWNDCTPGCAYTLQMLTKSETPVATLSQGKFGTQTNLPSADGDPAPEPICENAFGTFDEVGYNRCSSDAGPPEPAPIESCSPNESPTRTPTTKSPVKISPTRAPTTISPVKPTTPEPTPTIVNPTCGTSCENEWPRCVRANGDDGCDVCFEELQTPGSRLVVQGDCVVSCKLTDDMKELCDFETEEPTESPIASPSSAPSPEVCTQELNDEFFFKQNQKGGDVIKDCKWLNKKNKKQKKNICTKKVKHGTGAVTNPAQDVCQASCDSCGACYENSRSQFFTGKFKDGEPLYWTCKVLKKKSKKAIKKLCKKTEVDIYGPAGDVCPKTCEVGSC